MWYTYMFVHVYMSKGSIIKMMMYRERDYDSRLLGTFDYDYG
jgi:hypothetical protein